MLKLVLINIRNALILLAIAYFSIPFIAAVWSAFDAKQDERAQLVNYQGVDWAEQHFKEVDELGTDYRGYVVWRRKPYSGQTINVDKAEHIRVTQAIAGLPAAPATFFFGGSTMWGLGATDDATIPAYYQALARETAVNYGESGWTAHQSLNELTRLMVSGPRPAAVVFYDGVNEVAYKCQRGKDFFSHSNESRLRNTFKHEPTDFRYYLRSVETAASNMSREIFGHERSNSYDCHTNPQKADQVAEALLSDWMIAKFVAESKGARFFAFLQPVAYSSKTRLSHLELEADLGRQFEAVYPLIRAKMKESGIGIDLSAILDHDDYYYIDFCHVSPNANQVIAEGMRKAMMPATQVSGR